MGIWESIASGLSELLAHKLRSFLTMLGVIFGVAAVIAMVSIGEGARQEALAQLRLLGVDVVKVARKPLSGTALEKAQEKSPFGLNYGDMVAIQDVLQFAPVVVGLRQVTAEVAVRGEPLAAVVIGASPGFETVTRNDVSTGRFFTEEDNKTMSSVCILGSTVKKRLFGFENPLGKTVKLSGELFTVIGVLADREMPVNSAVQVPDQNLDIYIPVNVAIKSFLIYSEQPVPTNVRAVFRSLQALSARQAEQNAPLTMIMIKAGSEDAAGAARELVMTILKRRHNGIDDYEVQIPSELIRQSQETQRVFNIVMGAIAGISLLVGGIGIMNIMLATVTQRTREIGIRRCVGATRGDIMRQFLLEGLVITLLGGMVGVALGIGGANAISNYAGWKTVVNAQAVVLSLSVACGVGIIFGLYPALRAAYVDPITALRYE